MSPENLLRRRIERFVAAGAPRKAAMVLAAQVEVAEDEAVELLGRGVSPQHVLELLLERAAARALRR